jgi:dihydroflavonol-4-reductase
MYIGDAAMNRIYIVTGAKGHVGSTIIRYLKGTACSIRGLILPSEAGDSSDQVTYYKGDVTQIYSLDDVFSDTDDSEVVVIHTAGLISISHKITPRLYNVNVEGTRNIIRQCISHGVKRLLYTSSVHAIPEPDKHTTIKEVSYFSKDSVIGSYAKTKAEATQAVLDAGKQGLDTVIVHPSGILGPYDSGNNHMVQLVKMYLSNKLPAGVTGGYDFVDVRDVAKGCIAAVEKGKSGECYILSNRYCTVKDLIEIMRLYTNGKKKICLPIGLLKPFCPIFEGVAKMSHTRPLFTSYSLHTLESNGHFSHDKATMELGYNPRDIKLTIADTIAWLQGN